MLFRQRGVLRVCASAQEEVYIFYMCDCMSYLSGEGRGGKGEHPWVCILTSTNPYQAWKCSDTWLGLAWDIWLEILDIRVRAGCLTGFSSCHVLVIKSVCIHWQDVDFIFGHIIEWLFSRVKTEFGLYSQGPASRLAIVRIIWPEWTLVQWPLS